ncbi:hypothetical protein BH10ACT3_BH10ACT3_03650 [soil metagenome]
MAFKRHDVDKLLAETGRMCAICGLLHKVQVHHIKPQSEGGADTYENAIPLCPNCHDEVHAGYAPGRVSRTYSPEELRAHLERTKELAKMQVHLRPGNEIWIADTERLRFFSKCLDRPAFRNHFHQELSFSDFDQAMEDTLLALNTGFLRTRDGEVIERADGKTHLVNPEWREAMDRVAYLVGKVRIELREALALDRMFYDHGPSTGIRLDGREDAFRWDGPLTVLIDDLRNQAISAINGPLVEAGLAPLPAVGS